ncbi:MAG: RNA polymerase-binding protein DksA [Panacagrimonas sp.]
MAQSKTKNKAPVASRKAAKTAPKPAARKPRPAVAGSAKSAVKPVAKGAKVPARKAAPAKKLAAVTKRKPAKAGAKVAAKSATPAKKTTKVAAKPAPAVKKLAKPAPRRAVAASHRPQPSAVAVQARPSRKPGAAAVTKAATAPAAATTEKGNSSTMTEEQIRKAPESDYMNEDQLNFFGERLIQMRNEVLARELDVKERLHQREVFADPADRASAEEEHWLDLRLRERESLLLKKIDDALRRIRDKDYGYCEKTGEPIGIARLLARPTATVCVDIKGQDERAESQFRDR